MLEIVADEVLQPGLIVARKYRLDRVVGEGGMGIVWSATHVMTEKPCALKFLKGNRASDPRSHARLLHEARAVCRVRHPNVAQVHDILELGSGQPFIVMDLLEGESLASRLARGAALDLPAALALLLPVVKALSAAHEIGIAHRDLKPDNVFLERAPDGEIIVKVLDFGIAKRFDALPQASELPGPAPRPASRGGLTTTYSTIGTPSYMAPEQLVGGGDVGSAADVWAIGLMSFECLTRARPARDDETHGLDERAARAMLAREASAVPEAFVALMFRMMSLAPNARPTLGEVERVFSLHRGTDAPARSAEPVQTGPRMAWRPARVVWAFGALMVFTSVIAAVALFDRRSPAGTSPATTPPPSAASGAVETEQTPSAALPHSAAPPPSAGPPPLAEPGPEAQTPPAARVAPAAPQSPLAKAPAPTTSAPAPRAVPSAPPATSTRSHEIPSYERR